ncbi:hypothetical protein NLJ89_g6698 [Agrocybe chaxingu]|uniref:Major facilitator superfamily (MFS) profile domain-containing protein n=1 Tax=Agrocybe chaxingu TaxID=84603 RepID=A0A9W8MTU4_9AGAR|nr:hypothetical protein NLJ89_g6698 [Agrocybe chaxingu]
MSSSYEEVHQTHGVSPSAPGEEHIHVVQQRTPLPKVQLAIVMLINLAEPVTGTVIYPFINKFVRETGIINGDERRTGYYAGIIESVFFLSESLTVVQWGYLSDRYGRRPILVLGTLGAALAVFFFGLQTSFWPLVFFRCLQGIFNGNIGVSKTVIAELSDQTNIGDAFAVIPFAWSIGITVGPIIGGLLTDPAVRWPDTFSRFEYFRMYPYFLPCAAASFVAFIVFLATFAGLQETLASLAPQEEKSAENGPPSEETRLLTQNDVYYDGSSCHSSSRNDSPNQCKSDLPTTNDDRNDLNRVLFSRHLLFTLLNYAFLAFLDMGNFVLLPLMYSTSVPLGGLGLEPYRIGMILAAFGVINSVVQVFALGPLIRRYGARKMYIISFAAILGSFVLFPVLKILARRAGGVDRYVVACICLQLAFQTTILIGYGSMQILLIQDVPDRYLGTVNGVGQMVGSGTRGIAPTFASSLYSLSLEKHITGGNMVFYVLIGLNIIGIICSTFIPKPKKTRQ